MQLVEIDAVGCQSLQAVFACAADIIGLRALPLAIYLRPEFCADDDFVTPSVKRATDKFFALRTPVAIGRVEEIDSGIKRSGDYRGRRAKVEFSSEVVTAEAN